MDSDPTPDPRRAPPFPKGISGNPAGGKRKTLPKHGLATITELAARGVRVDTIARSVGMCGKTFQRLKADDPAVSEAYEAGRAQLHDELVDILVNKARAGDTISLLFSLKSIFGFRDQGPEAGEAGVHVHITLPGALPPEAYQRQVIEEGAVARVPEVIRG